MKIQALLIIMVGLLVESLINPLSAQVGRRAAGCADLYPNCIILPSNDPADADAVAFTAILAGRGFNVMYVESSELAHVFKGQEGAALYITSQGDFDTMFLPPPQTFENLQINDERIGKGSYVGTFDGRDLVFDSSRPAYFVKDQNRLVVAFDKELAARLQMALDGHP